MTFFEDKTNSMNISSHLELLLRSMTLRFSNLHENYVIFISD